MKLSKQMFLISLTFFTLGIGPVSAQLTDTKNYVISRTFKQAGASVNDLSQVQTKIEYLDGLGRPMQATLLGQSTAGTDIIKPIAYDPLNREANQFLPYVKAATGAYQSAGINDAAGWYTANSAMLNPEDLGRPVIETFFEQSPLNRPSGSRAPGNKSANSSIEYKVNDGTEVKRYDFNGTTVVSNGTYAAGTLTKTFVKDEQGNEISSYSDVLEQLICKKIKASAGEILTTYYVYDDLKQLQAVLQPNYQTASAPSLTDHAFTYDYDDRGRVIVKRIPGKGTVEIVYDVFDRPALSRDANQAQRGFWGFVKYDALNRPVVTGEISSVATRAQWATVVDVISNHHENRSDGTVQGYTLNNTAPTNAVVGDLRTITFYDDYSFQKSLNYDSFGGYYAISNSGVKGQRTGGRVWVLRGNDATGEWLTDVVYYDTEYRPIQTVRQLYDLGGMTERISTEYKYDLAAVPSRQKTVQGANSHEVTYGYDHADRLLQASETVAFGALTKNAYTVAPRYNLLGAPVSKWFHAYSANATRFRRKTDYLNNIRGWMNSGVTKYLYKQGGIDSTAYGFALSYENGSSYTNGNISKMLLRRKRQEIFTNGLSLTYDGANRLKSSTAVGTYADTESGINYDADGNILALNRGGAVVDNLTYSYTNQSNQLSAVSDGSGNGTGVRAGSSNYVYDANGNLKTDGNRNATITYNYLNLPKTVTVGGKTFTYDYDATGIKHKYAGDTLTVKYAGAFEYDGSNTLKRMLTLEGQVTKVRAGPTKDSLRFEYFLKDHLGNVRVVWEESGKTLQETGYYPFGLSIDRNDPVTSQALRNNANRYLYNGKELQVGSELVDYGARMYMPEIGRWGVVDPMSEAGRRFSGYTYGNDNPLIFVDPDGMYAIHLEGLDAQEAFQDLQREQENKEKSKGSQSVLDSPNVKAALAKAERANAFDPNYPRASGRADPDLSIESFVISGAALGKPLSWGAKSLAGLVRAQWLASKAAKEGTKLISQFSNGTVDDAVNLVMKNSNDVKHIFASKHNLGPLVNKLGGQENTIRSVLNGANGKLPANGIFNNVPVNVGDQTVFIRGSVVNGVPRIGTMFIP